MKVLEFNLQKWPRMSLEQLHLINMAECCFTCLSGKSLSIWIQSFCFFAQLIQTIVSRRSAIVNVSRHFHEDFVPLCKMFRLKKNSVFSHWIFKWFKIKQIGHVWSRFFISTIKNKKKLSAVENNIVLTLYNKCIVLHFLWIYFILNVFLRKFYQ